VVIAVVVGAGLAGYVFYKYRLRVSLFILNYMFISNVYNLVLDFKCSYAFIFPKKTHILIHIYLVTAITTVDHILCSECTGAFGLLWSH